MTVKERILVVDDEPSIRKYLQTLLEVDGYEVFTVSSGKEALERLETGERPDFIILDVLMPEMDGVEATARVKTASPDTRVLILTSFGEDEKVFAAIRAGAQGYLLKDIHPGELVTAVRQAYQGKVQLHPDIAQRLMQAVTNGTQSPAEREPKTQAAPAKPNPALDGLTERERVVLRLVAAGLNNREIAGQMDLSEKLVKTHVSSILSKLSLEDRTQAAIWAIKHGAD